MIGLRALRSSRCCRGGGGDGGGGENNTNVNAIPRTSYLFNSVCIVAFLSVVAVFFKVNHLAYKTKTVVGHNLKPTPWHKFQAKVFDEGTSYSRATKILQCQYFQCHNTNANPKPPILDKAKLGSCPDFFRWIHKDLEPWSETKISLDRVMEAKNFAAFRVIIVGGQLFVEFYYDCVQTRMMFTLWGLIQLLKRFPGMIPDVDMMFDCMDRPTISRTKHKSRPLPLFRYCTTPDHFDISFPDWSFWGWPEVNLGPWDVEFKEIKKGSRSRIWKNKLPFAHWKGNPDVASHTRTKLLKCNDTTKWGAEVYRQNWVEEINAGFKQSKLSSQCQHRYKIYAEGYAWSVSLKYIVSCGSLTLLITPEYEDFLTRGLLPKRHYWPVPRQKICQHIKDAVQWGNSHIFEAAKIGRAGQNFMETLSMDRVYDYMYHLISEYAKLQSFKPIVPSSSQEVCAESLLCFANTTQRQFLEQSASALAPTPPCILPQHDDKIIDKLERLKEKVITNT